MTTMTNPKLPGHTQPQGPDLAKLKSFLISTVTGELNRAATTASEREKAIRESLVRAYARTRLTLPENLRVQLFRDVINDLIGYGPIQSLLDDPEISEVMVNGPRNVFIEYKGKLIRTNTTFDNNEHVMRIIQRIVSPLGRQ